MKYIIMSAGKGERWNNYLGITKQEAKINNENLLERTVRLIRKYDCNSDIIIVSNNNNHYVEGSRIHSPIYKDYYKSKYTLELIDDEVTYLYGDTFYEDEIIEKIINSKINDVMFYGNSKAIVGLKVKDYIQFSNVISEYDGSGSLYKFYKKKSMDDNIERFYYVGSEYYNVNTPENYEELLYVYNQLFRENKLLCVGIIWNVGLQWETEIFDEISSKCEIIDVQKIDLTNNYYDFLNGIYDGNLSLRTINAKYESMKDFPEESLVCIFEVPNPHFEIQPQKQQTACKEVTQLKRSIRDKYRPITGSKFDNVIHMTDTPIEFIKNMDYISQLEVKEKVKLKNLIRR